METKAQHDAILGISIGLVIAVQGGATVAWVVVLFICVGIGMATKGLDDPTADLMLQVQFYFWPIVFLASWLLFAVVRILIRDAAPRLWLVIAISCTSFIQMALTIATWVERLR